MSDLLTWLKIGFTDRILAEPHWGDTTLENPAWRAAFNAVPRHLFAPDTWFEWTDGAWAERHRADDEDAWARAVYAVDQPLITQVDPDTGKPACSLSAPILVAAMLGALQLEPGIRVFESGAGCGWTASLMAERVGPDGLVASAEFDPGLAVHATVNVTRAKTGPLILTRDGEVGAPFYAPFDRVSATHSVRRIPRAWIDQTRPDGLVCAPLAVADDGLDVFVRLTVRGDGSVSGPVLFPLAFMPSRTGSSARMAELANGPGRESTTDLDLPALIEAKQLWVLQLAIPGLNVTGPLLEDGDDTVWLSTPDGSWSVAYVSSGAPWKGAVVEQHGQADVWTLAEAAWAQWEAAERPGLDEYGLTVEADGTHRLWMQTPDNVVGVS